MIAQFQLGDFAPGQRQKEISDIANGRREKERSSTGQVLNLTDIVGRFAQAMRLHTPGVTVSRAK